MKTSWQRHVLACSGYVELGMFEDARSKSEPEDKTPWRPRNEIWPSRLLDNFCLSGCFSKPLAVV